MKEFIENDILLGTAQLADVDDIVAADSASQAQATQVQLKQELRMRMRTSMREKLKKC